MFQVTNRAKAEGRASPRRSPSPQTPHPRATHPRIRGITFPVSYQLSMRRVDGNGVFVESTKMDRRLT